MPAPTIAAPCAHNSKRAASAPADSVQRSPPHADDDTCSGSEDMEAELRIVDAPGSDTRSPGELEAEETSTDNDSTPQDLRVLRTSSPPPITLAPPDVSKASASPLRPPADPPASRKRKSTTPTQDRRAKWLFGNGSPLRPPPPPLSPAVNGRALRVPEEPDAFLGPRSLLTHSAPGSEGATPLMSPAAQTTTEADQSTDADEDEEVVALRMEIGRFEEQLRSDFSAASERFCQRVESSVRQAVAAVQARHLATLSATATAAAAAAAASSQAVGPLPPLADINGNPALLSMKEVSKNMEQFMLASQCLPYRFIAAAAAAANSGRLAQPQLPYPPISGPAGTPGLLSPLLPPPVPQVALPFPLTTSGSCDSPAGTAADSDDAEGDGLPLNMSKKKRTKVTDNHLRAFAGLDVAAALPAALENLGVFNNMAAVTVATSAPPLPLPLPPPLVSTPSMSLTSTPLRGPTASFTDLSSTTLTPVHLRKAKLMFFFTRYPNSNVLKVYFPDVQFNKHNTAQIVKWFSNFREFYYIQIEKFARQAIAEGVQEADEISIMAECELIRNLNTHYNRNNQIPVPHHFITVVEVTVREFFKALVCHKDQDHSWKKPIYKVIARYDQPVPDDFKTATWIDHMDT